MLESALTMKSLRPLPVAASNVFSTIPRGDVVLKNLGSRKLGAALASALGSTAAAERLGVLAGDRGRAFSWREAADKVSPHAAVTPSETPMERREVLPCPPFQRPGA